MSKFSMTSTKKSPLFLCIYLIMDLIEILDKQVDSCLRVSLNRSM
ncbi:hypothetical protein Golob_004234, partial [Gossypium lobatum]|nr:hypothetical protein [Gossypium lobatum]